MKGDNSKPSNIYREILEEEPIVQIKELLNDYRDKIVGEIKSKYESAIELKDRVINNTPIFLQTTAKTAIGLYAIPTGLRLLDETMERHKDSNGIKGIEYFDENAPLKDTESAVLLGFTTGLSDEENQRLDDIESAAMIGLTTGLLLDIGQMQIYIQAQNSHSNLALIPVATNTASFIYEKVRSGKKKLIEKYQQLH